MVSTKREDVIDPALFSDMNKRIERAKESVEQNVEFISSDKMNGHFHGLVGGADTSLTYYIRTIRIPRGVTELDAGCFATYYPNLETVEIPDTVSVINGGAFNKCYSLSGKIVIPNSVRSIGSAVFEETNVDTIVFEDGLEEMQAGCVMGAATLKDVRLPSTLRIIPESAFLNCVSLEKIDIPSGVSEIDPKAFDGCTGLLKINVNKPKDSIAGAPWGAINAEVIWLN